MYQVNFDRFPEKVVDPPLLAESKQYVIKIAENSDEIEKALRLRYEVFNLEQGKGLESANARGVDIDEYDPYCLHMLVMRKEDGSPAGTYRIHLGSVASSAIGFYSSREFELSGIEAISHKVMELGRSCTAPDFRGGSTVALMWGGIGELLMRANLRYLVGCVSLEEEDPAAAWALYRHFQNEGQVSDEIAATPRPDFALEAVPESAVEARLSDLAELKRKIPPLFKGYLRIGCKVCGPPAIDREFKTIDFFIIVDSDKVPDRYSRHYNYQYEAE